MLRHAALLAAALLLLAGCSGAAEEDSAPVAPLENVHALFVGIDKYRFSDANLPTAAFSDLEGAVGDVERIKAALNDIYGLGVDAPVEGDCASANDVSTTLTDSCATRARILEALDRQIDRLAPGDTLLFYFAGHGSRYRDDEAFDQDSGYNGTILPHDARNPDGSPGDIFDIELKARKDRATARGLNFVTIFDSCNSGTATRDILPGASRSVPVLEGGAAVAGAATVPSAPAASAKAPGYWVHLAAAQDGEDAKEVQSGAVSERAGVFTSALIDTLRLPGMAGASFGDIIAEVQVRIAANGATSQTPSGEGRLTAALGGAGRDMTLFAAASDGEGEAVTLKAGAASGITQGSLFALYARQADALSGAAPLATGHVAAVDAVSARLKLDKKPKKALPDRLFARETAHFFAAQSLVVSHGLPEGPERAEVERILAATDFVRLGEGGAARLVPVDGAGGEGGATAIALHGADGTLLVDDLGPVKDPGFADRLTAELRKLARVQQLLDLRTETGGAPGEGGVSLCVAPEGYRPTACPPLERGGVRQLGKRDRVVATLVNRSGAPRYLYLLAIDPSNAIVLVLPTQGEIDRAIAPGQPYRRSFGFDRPGSYRFVSIVSDVPIRADAFQQSGSGTRDINACLSPLERLLCSASRGSRDVAVTRIGSWSASVMTAVVTDPASE